VPIGRGPRPFICSVACLGIVVLAACGGGSSHGAKAAASSTTAATPSGPTSRSTTGAASSKTVKARAKSTSTTRAQAGKAASTKPKATTTTTVPPTPPTTVAPATTTAKSDAIQVVQSRGYTPLATDDYANAPPDALHVIVASPTDSTNTHAQQAFFFVHGKFIRTDLKGSSATIKVAWRSAATIALSYAIYKPGEPICCPTGGAMIVRYQWTGTKLVALDPIPSSDARR
jgi:hypothetical protein